jgi:hypothetical protein
MREAEIVADGAAIQNHTELVVAEWLRSVLIVQRDKVAAVPDEYLLPAADNRL